MNKDRAARFITFGLLAAALTFIVVRKTGGRLPVWQQPSESKPQETIYGMLDAARAGDTKSYLARYTGRMEENLQQIAREKGETGFGSYLSAQNAEIKGVAIAEPKQISDREAEVRVEYVYQDRNEAQIFFLEKVSGAWKIGRVDGAERVKTLVPYGTPVE